MRLPISREVDSHTWVGMCVSVYKLFVRTHLCVYACVFKLCRVCVCARAHGLARVQLLPRALHACQPKARDASSALRTD